MTEPLEETSAGTIANASLAMLMEGKTILGLGPGPGYSSRDSGDGPIAVREAVIPVVLDADGLNPSPDMLGNCEADLNAPSLSRHIPARWRG